jgi:hypothetical protein
VRATVPTPFLQLSHVIPGLYTVVGTDTSTDYEDAASYDSVGDGNPQDDGNVVAG